jgi:hypothetical protein
MAAKMEAFSGSRNNQVQRLDLAGSGFLRLLRLLGATEFGRPPALPGHPIWKADVFSRAAYQAFAAQVAAAFEAGKEPEDLQIIKVLPILHDRMIMLREDVMQTVRQEVKAVFAEISELEGAVHNFG